MDSDCPDIMNKCHIHVALILGHNLMKNVSMKIICSQNDMSQMLVYSDVSFTDVDEWYLNALNKGFKLLFFFSL